MEAIVFDIDGTLLASVATDSDLFAMAVKEVLGIPTVNSNWSTYRHVTDQGILREIMQVNSILPEPELFAATRREFISLLRGYIEAHGAFQEIPGALDFVSRMVASDQHYVAYATGAWRESALLKLESAGFPTKNVRIATSSEFEDRVSIMRGAMSEAPSGIGKITYYGDAVWDQIAVQELGWEFVPVGETLGGLQHYSEKHGHPFLSTWKRKGAGYNLLSEKGAEVVQQALPNQMCPLCGELNQCSPAKAGNLDVECWCSKTSINEEALARVPEQLINKACLCPRCAAGVNGTGQISLS